MGIETLHISLTALAVFHTSLLSEFGFIRLMDNWISLIRSSLNPINPNSNFFFTESSKIDPEPTYNYTHCWLRIKCQMSFAHPEHLCELTSFPIFISLHKNAVSGGSRY